MGRSRHLWHETAFFSGEICFFLELCIVLSVVVHFLVDNRLVFYEVKGEDWRVF